MREAARLAVPVEAFAAGASVLAEGDTELAEGLDSWYRAARPLLRQEIVASTIAEHGNLALGLDWRVDMITRSHRGTRVNTPVAVFTFRYADGKSEKRFTLQLLPDVLDVVRKACDEILSDS